MVCCLLVEFCFTVVMTLNAVVWLIWLRMLLLDICYFDVVVMFGYDVVWCLVLFICFLISGVGIKMLTFWFIYWLYWVSCCLFACVVFVCFCLDVVLLSFWIFDLNECVWLLVLFCDLLVGYVWRFLDCLYCLCCLLVGECCLCACFSFVSLTWLCWFDDDYVWCNFCWNWLVWCIC